MTLRNCTESRYRVNKARMVPLAEYSRDCLRDLRGETGIAYDERTLGTLQLFRTQQQLDGTAKDIDILQQYDVPYQLLDRDGYVKYEPALALVRDKFVGALRLPGDETGDCFLFTQRLAKLGAEAGIEFRHGVNIRRLIRDRQTNTISGVDTDKGIIRADCFLVALGSYSPLLLRRVGIDLPVYPVKSTRSRCRSQTRISRPNRRSWTRRTR